MMNFRYTQFITICCAILFFKIDAYAQRLDPKSIASSSQLEWVAEEKDTIENHGYLNSSWAKLDNLKNQKTNRFTIVHIGDSHLQAGFFTSYVRRSMQSFFSNGGRGMVFPYQLAKSNAPKDILCSSNTNWAFNRLAHPEINTSSGISGFIIQEDTASATCNFRLVYDSTDEIKTFNNIRVFAKMPDSATWTLKTKDTSVEIHASDFNEHQSATIALKDTVSQFEIITDSSQQSKIIYGFSLENKIPGLIYHTIAVNGAQYEQYNISPNFWKQLPELNADMYIISLGTNEGQKPFFDSVRFAGILDTFLMNIGSISPKATIMICTAADNYKKGIPGNSELMAINFFLQNYCKEKKLACWDLYQMTGAAGSAKKWNMLGLMSKDRIHFNAAGYTFQGKLLFNAIMDGYQKYLKQL
jgi:hypothetical protein